MFAKACLLTVSTISRSLCVSCWLPSLFHRELEVRTFSDGRSEREPFRKRFSTLLVTAPTKILHLVRTVGFDYWTPMSTITRSIHWGFAIMRFRLIRAMLIEFWSSVTVKRLDL